MVREHYSALERGEEIRAHLIALKQEVKEEQGRKELLGIVQEDCSLLEGFLSHTDPKVRKNAALVLGRLGRQGTAEALYKAYQRETQLFVKSSYLDALYGLDLTQIKGGLVERLEELGRYKPVGQEEKHIRAERMALQKLVLSVQGRQSHSFLGYDGTYEILLTTGRLYQEVTAGQIKGGKVSILKGGVRAVTSHIKPILGIRTYRELLFFLDTKKVPGDWEGAAKGVCESNLASLLGKAHGSDGPFYFRLGIHGRMLLDKRGAFAKKCAFAIEQASGGLLRNSASDYEIEIRLLENRDGTFLPLVKLYTFQEERFAYRKHTVATSIRPEQAALAACLAKPYLTEGGQVLDPFCGVGTMLIERDNVCHAGYLYGLDTFGQAIEGAKENTKRAGKEIYYIHRDFFTFEHGYLFDEIITNMPDRGKKSKEEQDALYEGFFEKAGGLLKGKGKVILYSNEKNYVKKQLRIHKEFALIQEYAMDEKGIYYLFIIEKKEQMQ